MSNPTSPNIEPEPEPGYLTPVEEPIPITKKRRTGDIAEDEEIVKTMAFKKEAVSPMKENKYTVPNKDPVFHTVFGEDYDIEVEIHHYMDMYLSQDMDGFSSDVSTPAKLIHAITYTIATHNNRISFHNQQIHNKNDQLPKFKLDDLTAVVTNYFTENVAVDYQTGLNDIENQEIAKSLNFFKFKNIFILKKLEIEKILSENKLIEKYSIFKQYPSTINIKIDKVKFLSKIIKNGKIFYLGSNSKLIDYKNFEKKLPMIFGDFRNEEFFNLLEILNDTEFDYSVIKKLFFFNSGRWDIETYSGVLIKLPSDKTKESLELSLRILDDDKFNQIKVIDVRQKNQVVTNG